MKIYILVGIGGSVGSMLRILISIAAISPMGTLLVNFIGSFLLGWFANSTLARIIPPSYRIAITTGVIGSFTTFSTLSVEVVQLIVEHEVALAFLYMFSSMFGGLLFAYLGLKIGRKKG